jgi:hypothetical protein
MTAHKFAAAIGSVDWNQNVAEFLKDAHPATDLENANLRVAQWARQFEIVDNGNPALCFIREMQVASQNVAVLTALSLYKPAAGSMRAMLETALYYSYFRTHHSELEQNQFNPDHSRRQRNS